MAPRFASVDDYIASYPEETRSQLAGVRRTIRDAAPHAGEKISYGMATFTVDGKPLIYYAGWKNHVGLYPAPDGVSHVAAELDERGLRHSKGAIQFPIDQPLPRDLVERIVVFRADQQRAMKPARRRP